MSCGGSGSFTVMVNEQALLCPAGSLATQFTRFVPTANAEPLGGTQSTFTVPQLSVAGAVNTTLLAQLPDAVLTAMSGGQVICGGSGSSTVTVKAQVAVLLAASVAVQLTGVGPFAKALPLGGIQRMFTAPHRSVAVTLNVTLLKQLPGDVSTVTSARQVIVGGVVSTMMTVWLHVAMLPELSVPRQARVAANVPPQNTLVTVLTTVTAVGPQLSLAVGVSKLHGVPHSTCLMAAQVITGGVLSSTMTKALHELEAPLSSATISVTRLVPRG